MSHGCSGIWMGLVAMVLALPCVGQTAGVDGDSQLEALRKELADLKLSLQQTREELEDLRDFLVETDVEATFEKWRTERDDLLEQRRLLAMERTKLETARKDLHQETYRQALETAALVNKQRQAEVEAVQPRWSAQYMLGLIEKDKPTIYLTNVRSARGYLVSVDQYPDIDRRNVMVRGTFQNKSLESWRYTFEIRVAGDSGGVLGVWRYQTPVQGPGDLHSFDVKVPVTEAQLIDVVQITNVTADRPAVAATQSPVEGTNNPITTPGY